MITTSLVTTAHQGEGQTPPTAVTGAAGGIGTEDEGAKTLLKHLAASHPAVAWQVLQWLLPLVTRLLQQQQGEGQGLQHPAGVLNPKPQLQLVGWCFHCISKHCLPVLPVELPPDASAATVAGVQGLVEAWEAWAVASTSHATAKTPTSATAATAATGSGRGSSQQQQQEEEVIGAQGGLLEVGPTATAAPAVTGSSIKSTTSSSSSSSEAAAWDVLPTVFCCIAELMAKCSSKDLRSLALDTFATITTAATNVHATSSLSGAPEEAAAAAAAGGPAATRATAAAAGAMGALSTFYKNPSDPKGFVDSVRVGLAAAVVVGLRGDLQQGDSMRLVLQGLAKLSCGFSKHSVLHPLAASTAAVAMAAVANKWQQQQQTEMQETSAVAAAAFPVVLLEELQQGLRKTWNMLLRVLQHESSRSSSTEPMEVDAGNNQQQQQQEQEEGLLGLVEAFQQHCLALSWLSRGLAMQRSNAWQGTAELLLGMVQSCSIFSSRSSSTGEGEAVSTPAPAAAAVDSTTTHTSSSSSSSNERLVLELLSAAAAGAFFHTLVSDHATLAGLGLKPSLHAVARTLWQQKAVTLTLQQLKQAMLPAAAAAGGGGITGGAVTAATIGLGSTSGAGVQQGPVGGLSGFWQVHVAVAGLLAAVPPGVWKAVATEAVPLLVRSVKVVAGLAGGSSSSSSKGKGSSRTSSGSGSAAAGGGGQGPFAAITAGTVPATGTGMGSSRHQGIVDSIAVQLQLEVQRQLQVLLHGCLLQLSNVLMEAEQRKLLEEDVGDMLEGLMLLVEWKDNQHQHQQQLGQQQQGLMRTDVKAMSEGLQGFTLGAGGHGLGYGGWGFVVAGGGGGVSAGDVREVALLCLSGAMGLPYHVLHPYRKRVVAVVSAALDDDRRAVRRAAVKCRRVWSVK